MLIRHMLNINYWLIKFILFVYCICLSAIIYVLELWRHFLMYGIKMFTMYKRKSQRWAFIYRNVDRELGSRERRIGEQKIIIFDDLSVNRLAGGYVECPWNYRRKPWSQEGRERKSIRESVWSESWRTFVVRARSIIIIILEVCVCAVSSGDLCGHIVG